MSIHEKLKAIQSSLHVPKSQRNTFGNYNYRSCEDILEALKPILAKEECTLTLSDSIEMVGTRFYVKATATLSDASAPKSIADEGCGRLSCSAFAREEETKKGMDGSQITGSSSSYARKYALNGLFLIDDTKDADTMDNRKEEAPKKAPGKTPQQPADPTLIMEYYTGAKTLDELNGYYQRSMTHKWSEENKATLNECYQNCLKKFQAAA